MIPFDIIGTGPGGKGSLTFRAFEIIQQADILVGSKRAINIVDFIIREKKNRPEFFFLKGNKEEMVTFIKNRKDSRRLALLVTGDAGFYSLLYYISRYFDKSEYRISPGISSVQIAASRMGLLWNNAFFYSIHGRDVKSGISDFTEAFYQGRDIYMLTDKQRTPLWFTRFLHEKGFQVHDMEIILFFNLDYEDEKIIHTDYNRLAEDVKNEEEKLCVMLIRKKG